MLIDAGYCSMNGGEAFGPTGLQVYQNVTVRTVSTMVGDFSVNEVNHNSLVFVRCEVPFRWGVRGGHLRKITFHSVIKTFLK